MLGEGQAAGCRGVVAPGVCSLRGRQRKFHRPARQNLSELPLTVHYQPASAAENSGNRNRSGVFPQPVKACLAYAKALAMGEEVSPKPPKAGASSAPLV